ncbi:RNA-guided pseudouridylation complex pseudouridine synthase subunit Cbf5 [Halobaculum halobium]|uniref:Probable tRNA pseudouridine synthase B n=1 Tax=Halobaculum halobium TaxID=3032281 RepID=A0ABD5TAL8_9EURY|nr:RNA-guided pseudouridylation complex pseudouridine synthase subunit Cbf5 [Halobaculum sp. SYNS20]
MRPAPENRSVGDLADFGVVNLDKPAGPSAHQVAGWVRDVLGVDRAAHSGTLDPKVTGCLPTLTGDATRMAQVFLEGAKEYVAVLELHGTAPTDLERVVGEFEGELFQKPPRKSAVNRQLRTREVHDLDVLDRTERQVLLRVRCESGTYIRKLCHDIGLALGTGGHMGHLRRTATDPFDDRDLHTLHDLVDGVAFAEGEDTADGEPDESLVREVLRPAEEALTGLPSLTIADSAAREVANGAPVYAPGVLAAGEVGAGEPAGDGLLTCYTPNGSAVCLGRLVGDPDAESGEVVALERVLV